MTGKRVSLGLKPGSSRSADEWVGAEPPRQEEGGDKPSIKRLTVDIPESLHRRLKIKAAQDGVRMVDLVRSWIEDGCAE